MKKIAITILLALAAVLPLAAYTPSEANLKARQEFQDNKLGVFIHWGVYSMLADGEWVMHNKRIDRDEYAQLPAGFYPSRFDADEWVRTIKDAGARYITITSRHHDGFSMFKSNARSWPMRASAMASSCTSTIPISTGTAWIIRWAATRSSCLTTPRRPTGRSTTSS